MNELTVYAYAKINLSLDILGVLPNGYHEVCMIMQSLKLHDTLVLTKNTEGRITLTCSDSTLPTDEKNLAFRAAKAFLEHFSLPAGVTITLEKTIPCAAGLAGGSSDAAAVLRGLNELFEIHAPLSELSEIGVSLGADVPYCLLLGTALSEGIGERLTVLPAAPDCCCLLVKPEAGASTAQIYHSYDALEATGAIPHPDTPMLLEALKDGSLASLCAGMKNVLEPVTRQLVPEIADIETRLLELKADGVMMSGSGPTVFALFSSEENAKKVEEYFRSTAYASRTYLTSFYRPEK